MKSIYFFILAIIISSCNVENEAALHFPPEFMEIPKGFEEITFPEDNPFTIEKWEIGKKLFYDPIMSIDTSISCGSCHKIEAAFSDDVALSLGVDNRLGSRNSPSLANIAYHPYFTREGGVPTLEMQILIPIQEHNEFDFNLVLLAERLSDDPSYIQMAQSAFDREPDAFTITRSLACFERSLISGYSPYDHYINYGDESALSEAEIRGKDLYFGEKTNCSSCHGGFNFTNYAFENNGLYSEYADPGRFRLTGEDEDLSKFKIPSLRNIELTAPYMHDGSIASLEQVIEHYNLGGKNHPNKNPLIKSLGLTKSEKNDLLVFLKSLTDVSFVNNPLLKE